MSLCDMDSTKKIQGREIFPFKSQESIKIIAYIILSWIYTLKKAYICEICMPQLHPYKSIDQISSHLPLSLQDLVGNDLCFKKLFGMQENISTLFD